MAADGNGIMVQIITKEAIKPTCPTPANLRRFKLSLFDQLAPDLFIPLILFYTDDDRVDPDRRHSCSLAPRSERLKASLSKILIHFYPLAGRIRDETSIECNDDGAQYEEARVNCSIFYVLERPDPQVMKKFLPIDVETSKAGRDCPLLYVRANFFNCGGMAIGICFSHKFADAATFSTFIKSWAAIGIEPSQAISLEYSAASILPPVESSPSEPSNETPKLELTLCKCATRRYVFTGAKIAVLKAKSAPGEGGGLQPSRVAAVTALIWKCAMAASRTNAGFSRQSVLSQAVNLRKRTAPPLPENTMGNLSGNIFARTQEGEIKLQEVVSQLKEKLDGFTEDCGKKLRGEEGFSFIMGIMKETGELLVKGDEIDYYMFSSWCRFPLYDADFGWGKPAWVGYTPMLFKSNIVLMDSRDGDGIEAWVTLSEEDMALFERDQELLEYASLNPSALG